LLHGYVDDQIGLIRKGALDAYRNLTVEVPIYLVLVETDHFKSTPDEKAAVKILGKSVTHIIGLLAARGKSRPAPVDKWHFLAS
jgi:hypothetical protein